MPELPSIAKAARDMHTGELTPVDLVEHCLARIDELDSQIQAWVMVDRAGARKEAERLTKLAADDDWLGPLHGIPVGIKDIIDVAGWPTKCGSPLRADQVAQRDAAVVTALRNAGAILLGKTVTTEWACFDPPPKCAWLRWAHKPAARSSAPRRTAASPASSRAMASCRWRALRR